MRVRPACWVEPSHSPEGTPSVRTSKRAASGRIRDRGRDSNAEPAARRQGTVCVPSHKPADDALCWKRWPRRSASTLTLLRRTWESGPVAARQTTALPAERKCPHSRTCSRRSPATTPRRTIRSAASVGSFIGARADVRLRLASALGKRRSAPSTSAECRHSTHGSSHDLDAGQRTVGGCFRTEAADASQVRCSGVTGRARR